MTTLDIALRIILAMVIGGLIGWERESTHRPAGLRTHMLVCIGSAMVMLTGYNAFYEFAGMTNPDPARMGAQVISGIGFLGAGTIMKEGFSIKGLTTAASLWAVACLGLAAGSGFYQGAILGTFATFFTLTIFEHLEKQVTGGKRTRIYVEIVCDDASKTLLHINRLAPQYSASIRDINIVDEEFGDDRDVFRVAFKLYSSKPKIAIDNTQIMSELNEIPGVSNVKMEEF